MYNGLYTNISDIIERVTRYGFDVNEEEAKEWTWEVLSNLGVSSIYIDKRALLTVENGRTFIPIDCSSLISSQLRDYYSGAIISKSTDTFFPSDEQASTEATSVFGIVNPGTSVVYDSDGTILSEDEIAAYIVEYPSYEISSSSLTYAINNGQFIFGFDSGLIELAYKAFPTDSNGDPMIPDNSKCIRAVMYYIMEQIAFRMNLSDLLSDRKLASIERKRAWAISSCRSSMNLGTIDDWDNAMRAGMRLRRDINQRNVGYKTMSNREHLKF